MDWDLLVCDLDGTLVAKKAELDPALVEGFHRARERGLRIALATGRMPPGAERFREELGLTDPCIFYNGALIRDHEEGRDLFSLTLPRGLLAKIYDEFVHAPVHPLFYRDDHLYCLEQTFPVQEYADEQRLRWR
jgi:hydroxymethylpyrimidine pyrophosphatase-like HAD family hydrolase